MHVRRYRFQEHSVNEGQSKGGVCACVRVRVFACVCGGVNQRYSKKRVEGLWGGLFLTKI